MLPTAFQNLPSRANHKNPQNVFLCSKDNLILMVGIYIQLYKIIKKSLQRYTIKSLFTFSILYKTGNNLCICVCFE